MTRQPDIYGLGFDRSLYRVLEQDGAGAFVFSDPSAGSTSPTVFGAGSSSFEVPALGQSGGAGGSMGGGQYTFDGEIIGGALHIPAKNGVANSFHTDNDGNSWWGCTTTNFLADNNNALSYILKSGVAKFQSVTITGSVTATAGVIGGFDIGSDFIRDAANSFGLASTVTADDDIRFWAGTTYALRTLAPIRIMESGSLYASSANITGTVVATAGTIGGWYIGSTTIASGAVTAAANIVLDQSTGQIRVGPTTGTYLIIDGGNAQIRTSNFASGTFGSGFLLSGTTLEVGNARIRGTLTSVVFEKTQVASVGGTILVSKGSDVLASNMTALDASTMITNGKETFNVGDFLRINIAGVEEWFEVTVVDSAPTYTVTRDKAAVFSANANPAWTAGTVVVNYGASGAGGIAISASGTPKLDIFTHAGAPWTTTTTQLRIGNLNGFLDYTTNLYGIAIGTSTAYMKYDPTNGLRLKSTASQIDVGVSGYVLGGQTAYATGTGFFLGNDSGSYKLSIGNTTEYIRWSGSSLLISGGFLALYPIGLATYAFASLPITIVDTTAQSPTATS